MLAIDDAERSKFLEKMTEAILNENPKLQPLLDKILEIDGDFVVLPLVEDDLDKLLERGVTFDCPVRIKKMAASQCHRNSGDLYDKNRRRYRIATGYALSDDGVWRQHSWVYDTYEKCLVETTEPRAKYFGFVMDKDESDEFRSNNY